MPKFLSSSGGFVATGLLLAGTMFAQQSSTTSTTSTKTPSSTPTSRTHHAAASQAPLTLKTEQDKVSYAIGMNIGARLHEQSMQLDPKILAKGISDALAGRKTLLTEQEAQTVLMQAQREKLEQLAAANKSESDTFLATNRAKEGVTVLPSGLQYKVLQQGTGPKPTLNDVVVCNYRGTLLNGTEFDSSYKRGQPVTIPVGRVIKGWTEALQLMPVGSKWQLFIPADLAYGERGVPQGGIGPNSALIFDVELLSIKNPEPAAPATGAAPQSPAPATAPPAKNGSQPQSTNQPTQAPNAGTSPAATKTGP